MSTMPLIKPWLIVVFLFAVIPAVAQGNGTGGKQNLYFVNTKHPDSIAIFRYSQYEFVLQNGKWLTYRVRDIRSDSIYGLVLERDHWDSLALSPRQLGAIRYQIMEAFGPVFARRSLRGYHYVFEADVSARQFDWRFEKSRFLVASEARMKVSDGAIVTDTLPAGGYQTRNGVWFTPSEANVIKGLNIGIVTTNFDNYPLSIRGVNLSLDFINGLLAYVWIFRTPFENQLVNMPDTIQPPDPRWAIRGVSISGGGLIGYPKDYSINGFAINGGICHASTVKGLVITGTQNVISGDFHGVLIGGLRNKAVKGRGVQIGVLNVCKNFKGVQIGLWNVNSKRRLPIVNWGS